jgi:hypothetical protein
MNLVGGFYENACSKEKKFVFCPFANAQTSKGLTTIMTLGCSWCPNLEHKIRYTYILYFLLYENLCYLQDFVIEKYLVTRFSLDSGYACFLDIYLNWSQLLDIPKWEFW